MYVRGWPLILQSGYCEIDLIAVMMPDPYCQNMPPKALAVGDINLSIIDEKEE